MKERTSVATDGVTGELFQMKLTPAHEHIKSWARGATGETPMSNGHPRAALDSRQRSRT